MRTGFAGHGTCAQPGAAQAKHEAAASRRRRKAQGARIFQGAFIAASSG
jgi:hypothetical protein